MTDNIYHLHTEKQVRQDNIDRAVLAITSQAPELSSIICFARCKDGSFMTSVANADDCATLGYSQAILADISADMAHYMLTDAEDITPPQ